MTPPPGYEDFFFGEPPHKSFQTDETFAAFLPLILNPTHSTLEDSIYHFKDCPSHGAIVEAIETLSHLLETEGPFDGILGFSEGSGLAATLLADHITKSRAAGRNSMLKLGIFCHSWRMESGCISPTSMARSLIFGPSTSGEQWIHSLPPGCFYTICAIQTVPSSSTTLRDIRQCGNQRL